jgi:hypothetical protein
MKLDRRTAVVTLTHDPKLDDPALQTALKADVFYVGALGQPEDPRRTPRPPQGCRLQRHRLPRAYMGLSASTSARCRRPRSPSRSWRKSQRVARNRRRTAREKAA